MLVSPLQLLVRFLLELFIACCFASVQEIVGATNPLCTIVGRNDIRNHMRGESLAVFPVPQSLGRHVSMVHKGHKGESEMRRSIRLQHGARRAAFSAFGVSLLLGLSGCVATQGWVQKQLAPLQGRVAQVETHLEQTETKADLALKNLEHLRLEPQAMLRIKEGANFAVDSVTLTAEARHAIDTFLAPLNGTHDVYFLVAGHTDNTGPEGYNYTLGQRRAASVARYLTMHKGIDPLRVTTMSYGEHVPLAGNMAPQGRRKNRRVEILTFPRI
jgi:outer membrane protein OmpA-like peptidoglycan-associated protein